MNDGMKEEIQTSIRNRKPQPEIGLTQSYQNDVSSSRRQSKFHPSESFLYPTIKLPRNSRPTPMLNY